MKKTKRILSLLLVAVMVFALASCGSKGSDNSKTSSTGSEASGAAEKPTATGDYDLYIFNTKGENADAMEAAGKAFGEEKGVTVKVFSLGSGTNSDDTLRTEMNSKNKPAIFSTMNSQALVEWVEGGFAMDHAKATNEEFKKLVSEIPEGFNLTDGTANYGVPYNVEGYGYIADTQMLSDLFGADKLDSFLAAFKTATYEEFEAMVHTLEAYIKEGTAGTVTLSGTDFATAAEKTGKATSLEGVFSVAGSEKWTYGDHFVNIAVDAVFANSKAASQATLADLEAGKGAFKAYAKALDLKTANATTERGPELINATTNGYDPSVANFANSKAIFLKQGNWAYENIKKANAEIADNLTFLPVKMPFTQDDIKVEGLTVDHMLESIPVFVPNYYVINDKVSDEEKELAQEFLVWLNTSEAGQKFVVEDMAFIPYNADPATTSAGYSLGDSIISYIADGKTLTNAYAGAPAGWSTDTFGQYMMENYVNKTEWTDADYDTIADYIISSWAEMANLS
ncbi:ABC transporter substrate-binding protein [Scatolibacter rhodanostii]|uniref:ABC transporter substrate-binding protein n=1 Tax=Scatolibacter rhodanostii TaxID=2014781 RepID=UPI000C086A0D|nr:ABC transporter substrate-binding protein [Scatolibacter rhodanostii]